MLHKARQYLPYTNMPADTRSPGHAHTIQYTRCTTLCCVGLCIGPELQFGLSAGVLVIGSHCGRTRMKIERKLRGKQSHHTTHWPGIRQILG